MSRASVKDRWRGRTGQALGEEAVRRVTSGAPLGDLGLGMVDGRVDLRGLWLVSLKSLPRACVDYGYVMASDVTMRDIDWSHGTLPIHMTRCHVNNVKFDHVGWCNWRATTSVFTRCTFTRADMRDSNWDGYNGGVQGEMVRATPGRYIACDFTRTRFGARGALGRATFQGCRFDNTAFGSPLWVHGADLVNCTFHGRFRTVCFGWTGPFDEPPPLVDDVDVTDASFESLEVYAIRGSGLITSAGQEVYRP